MQPDQNTPVLSPSQPGAQLTPPPAGLLGDAKLDAAFAEHRDLAAAADCARAAARNLENSRQVAIEADDKALGAALRSGEPDPGQKAQRYIEQAIVTARRTAAGLESAFGDSRTELLAMLAKRQEAIAEHIDAQLAAETESLIAVVREQLRSGWTSRLVCGPLGCGLTSRRGTTTCASRCSRRCAGRMVSRCRSGTCSPRSRRSFRRPCGRFHRSPAVISGRGHPRPPKSPIR